MIIAQAFLRFYSIVGSLHWIILEPFVILFLLLPDTGHSLQVAFAAESLLRRVPSRTPLGIGEMF